MAGDGVAVVEVTVLLPVEFDLLFVVEPGGDAAIWRDGFDDGQIAVSDADGFVRRGELDAIADREFMGDLAVDTHTGESAWVVGRRHSQPHLAVTHQTAPSVQAAPS